MKRTILSIICILASAAAVSAQDIHDGASYLLNTERSLWYGTSCSAGLAREDMALWRNAALGGSITGGSFTDAWEASRQNTVTLGGDMLMDIAGFKVAAEVNFDADRLHNSRYNNSLYSLELDMPFFVALNDDEEFLWKRGSASALIRAASPLLLDDALSLGLGLNIKGKGADKNKAPTARYSGFELEIAPSATYAIDSENTLGLTLSYKTMPESSRINKGGEAVSVALMNGLGSFSNRWAGGDAGIGDISYCASLMGADLFYNRPGLLLRFSLHKGSTTVSQAGTTIGQVDKFLMGAGLKYLAGGDRGRILNLDVDYNLNYWLKGGTTTADNSLARANLGFTRYTSIATDGSFDWTFGAGADFNLINLRRYVPDATLKGNGITPYVKLGKNLKLAHESSLLVTGNLGYNFAFGADYSYGGSNVDGNYFVNDMYSDEAEYLGSYYLRAGLDARYTYRLNTLLSAYAAVGGVMLVPTIDSSSRAALALTVGVLF